MVLSDKQQGALRDRQKNESRKANNIKLIWNPK